MINHVKRNTWNSCLIHKKEEIWKLLWAILQISKKLIYLIFFLSIFLENYNNKKSKFFSYDNCNLIMFWFFNFLCHKTIFSGKMHNSIILKNIFTVMRHFCLMGRLQRDMHDTYICVPFLTFSVTYPKKFIERLTVLNKNTCTQKVHFK